MTGLLLRSQLVAGWPSLGVRPCDPQGNPMKILRMDHLSPNVLLCMFSGTPASISLCEPQEGFRFGVEKVGEVGVAGLRNVVPGTLQVGEEFKPEAQLPVRDLTGVEQLFMRAAGSRVLDIDPTSTGGLLQSLAAAVEKASGVGAGAFGPADFALQMVDAPEAVTFNSPGGG
jgi:hypothetical protein